MSDTPDTPTKTSIDAELEAAEAKFKAHGGSDLEWLSSRAGIRQRLLEAAATRDDEADAERDRAERLKLTSRSW